MCSIFACGRSDGVARNDIKMYLHTSTTNAVQLKAFTRDDLKINPQNQMKILIHGWMDDKDSYWYEPAVKAYMQKGDVNVITVDWGKYAKGLFTKAVSSVQEVGEYIGDTAIEICTKYGIAYSDFHLIGHSLGSHIAGFAGKHVILKTGVKVGRITGLDPAGPSYEGNHPDDRLCSEDADLVDIIHTDAGVLGYEKSLGHIDFFPNGGKRKQNGCSSSDVGCSHKRAPLYMAESVNSLEFVAVLATDYSEFDTGRYSNDNPRTYMGEHVDRKLRGDFYLNTNKESPFGKGKI